MPRSRSSQRLPRPLVAVAVAVPMLLVAVSTPSFAAADDSAAAMPQYSAGGALLLPEAYQQWILVGSSLGLSYSQAAPGHQMFHNTLMEPSAHRHYVETGEFRDGTMLVLLLFGQGDAVTPGRHGSFASELQGVEMAVKDLGRFEEGWAYYNFSSRAGLRREARALGRQSCHACHAEHAKQDNVFVQFYPMLVQAAALRNGTPPAASSDDPAPARGPESQQQSPEQQSPEQQSPEREGDAVESPPLALDGLDPVHLIEGREEMGKPEIVMVHGRYRYQFVSEPSRARFETYPEAYSIRNDTCPVVPGAPIDPSLFTVHDETIYAFATPQCVTDFEADPEFYLEPEG